MPRISSGKVEQRPQEEGCCLAINVLEGLRSGSSGDRSVSSARYKIEPGSESDAATSGSMGLGSVDGRLRSGGYYRVYPRGRGACDGPPPYGHAVVSRWTTPEEAEAWLRNLGTAIPSGIGGDRLYVALPGARQPAGTGPVRLEFAVPKSALIRTGHAEWRVILQPVQSTPIHNVVLTVPVGVLLPDDK
jgi:hypothetical protein